MLSEQVRSTIEARTIECGRAWSADHARRLLRWIERIAGDRAYDEDAVYLAAYLHDWGFYEPWARPGVDHGVRSAEIIPGVLSEFDVDAQRVALVAECARHHHSCGRENSFEAMLLHDADALELVGVTGVLRTFSMVPRDLRGSFDRARARCKHAREHLLLDRSRELAAEALESAEKVLAELERETGGVF